MPAAPVEDLERGAVCLALYPFVVGFPLEQISQHTEDDLLAEVTEHPDIDSIERTIEPGDVPKVAVAVKLRRVLLLQTGTTAARQDIMVARISHISDTLRARERWYQRVRRGQHPTCLLLDQRRHGVSTEAYVNVLTITSISKSAILRRTGGLNDDEMREISRRVVTSLELDISHLTT